MRWIAVSLGTCLAVSLLFLGWVALTDSENHAPRAEAAPQTQRVPEAQTRPQTQPQAQPRAQPALPSNDLVARVLQDRRLVPRQTRFALGGWPPLVAAGVVGRTRRYVLKTEAPVRFLNTSQMLVFLYGFRFGVKRRRMVVRLLDGDGRFAWAAGYNGDGKTWVRARADLAGCAPDLDAPGLSFPRPRLLDPGPCPLEPPDPPTATVLR